MSDRVEVYRDEAQEWRWRRVAPNGEIVSDSAEGYVEKDYALQAAARYNSDVLDVVIERD